MSIPISPNLRTHSSPMHTGDQETYLRRMNTLRIITVIVGVLSGMASVGLLLLNFQGFHAYLFGLALSFAVTALFSLTATGVLQPRGLHRLWVYVLSVLFGINLLASSAILAGLGIAAGITFLLYALVLSTTTGEDNDADLAICLGFLGSAGCAMLTAYSPLEQLTIRAVEILSPIVLAIVFITYVVLMAKQYVAATMRIRLIFAFTAIVVIPLAVLSYFYTQVTTDQILEKTHQSLELAAKQTASGLDQFLEKTATSTSQATKFSIFHRYLALPEDQREGSPEEAELRLTMQILDTQELNNTVYLASFALLDMNGINVFDSMSDRITSGLTTTQELSIGDVNMVTKGKGTDESNQDYFLIPARSGVDYASPLLITDKTTSHFYVSSPIKDNAGEIVGVLRVRYDGYILQRLLQEYSGLLGKNAYAILLDENHIRLADTLNPTLIYKSVTPLPSSVLSQLQNAGRFPDLPESMISTNDEAFNNALLQWEKQPIFSTELSTGTTAENEMPEIGYISRLQSMPWKVVYLLEDFDFGQIQASQNRLTISISSVLGSLVGMIAIVISRLLNRPIASLMQTAQRIAKGDLDARVKVTSSDEFGMLGNAFNQVTSQFRSLISELEERVRERTQELEKQNGVLISRSKQFQTVAEVARQIVTANDMESLLTTVTHLISDRFGFYHIGIFLLDENKEYALLRAANSEGGQRMLARRHMLPVGKVGIVGYVTGHGEPRIATDVGEDAVYFNNPDLPNTRSEMALPLKVNNEIIGALDIQSVEPNAFQPDDIDLFTALADQVAIAINNNRLYSETLRALDEAQTLHRQYLRSEWDQDINERKVHGYLYNRLGITPQEAEIPIWETVLKTGEPVIETNPVGEGGQDQAVMAVPISVRGETIGVIHVQDQGEDREWTEDEIAVINGVANQVAIALENARLFENTVRRADRERKVLEITAQIRSTNDPAQMMQIAISELQRTLGASRAQIYVRQQDQATGIISGTDEIDKSSNGKGSNGANGRNSQNA